MFNKSCQLGNRLQVILDINFSDIRNISFEQYEKIISTIETLKERIEMIGHPHNHPFWGCEIQNINEYEQQQISKSLDSVLQQFESICNLINSFSNELSIELINLSTAISYCQLLTILSEEHQIPISLAKLLNVDKYYLQIEPV